jgi:hypothetical protein
LKLAYPTSPTSVTPINTVLAILQIAAGTIAFFVFFAGLFNGLEDTAYAAAAAGLTFNFCVSGWVARRDRQRGLLAALLFAAPAGAFALFAIGDLLASGKAEPFLFWSAVALAGAGAGLLGALASIAISRRR